MVVAAADDLLKFLVCVSYDGMVASSAFSRTALFMRIESIGLPKVWVRSDCLVLTFATACSCVLIRQGNRKDEQSNSKQQCNVGLLAYRWLCLRSANLLRFSPFLIYFSQVGAACAQRCILHVHVLIGTAMAGECDAVLEGKLYVGSYAAAQDTNLLNAHNITHVVSAGFRAPPTDANARRRRLCIDVRDEPNQNLLRHLPRATAFIQRAIDDGSCVFVHCVHGQSRSCAIVVAYLMRLSGKKSTKASASSDDPRSLLHQCYRQVETARPCMAINPGFVRQLEIYRRMICCTLDRCDSSPTLPPMSRAYAAYRSFRARFEFEESGQVSKWFPATSATLGDIPKGCYRCRNCRQFLFFDSNIIDELTQEDELALPKSEYWATTAGGLEYSRASSSDTKAKARSSSKGPIITDSDNAFRTEPMIWMQLQMEAPPSQGGLLLTTRRGKLACPHCSSKIGSWDWEGADAWSSVFISPGRVERMQ